MMHSAASSTSRRPNEEGLGSNMVPNCDTPTGAGDLDCDTPTGHGDLDPARSLHRMIGPRRRELS